MRLTVSGSIDCAVISGFSPLSSAAIKPIAQAGILRVEIGALGRGHRGGQRGGNVMPDVASSSAFQAVSMPPTSLV